jgi:phosphate transport system protein
MSSGVHELNEVKKNLEKLGHLVLGQLRHLKSAFGQADPTLTETLQGIVSRDEEIDRVELDLDRMCLLFMNHQAPLGRSLRYMIGAIDIAAGLERIGDCTEYVARHLLENAEMRSTYPEAWKLLHEMTDKCLQILDRSVASLINRDAVLAQQVPPLDNLVDALQDKAYSMAIADMRTNKVDVELGMMLILMANKLESVADISCHIAGTVVFIVKARRLRHSDDATNILDESE